VSLGEGGSDGSHEANIGLGFRFLGLGGLDDSASGSHWFVCVYVCVRVCVGVVYVCMYMYMCVCTCINVHVNVYVCMYMYVDMCTMYIWVCTFSDVSEDCVVI
jgi:hypothetical protein